MFEKEIAKLQQLQSLEHALAPSSTTKEGTADDNNKPAAETTVEDKGQATMNNTNAKTKESNEKPSNPEVIKSPDDEEPALVLDDKLLGSSSSSRTSSKIKFSEPAPKEEAANDKSADTSSRKPTSKTTTIDNTVLERACREDPERIRRELLQGAIPCTIRGEEKRQEFTQRRIRQYYTHVLESTGREIDWDAEARFQKEQEEHRMKVEEYEKHDEALLLEKAMEEAQTLVAPAAAAAEHQRPPPQQQQPQQPQELVQERLDGPAPPPRQQEQHPQLQQLQPPPPAAPVAQDDIFSWLLDPVLHAIIITMSVLCFLLLRKLQLMVAELNELNEMLEG